MTFNEKYHVSDNRYINIELDTDNKLFVDPYLIYLGQDEISNICSNRVVNYFSQLLKAAEVGNDELGEYLVKYLQENNEVYLGYSKQNPCGKGFGRNKGIELYENIKNSKAMKSGLVKDIFDASIMLENVGYDKISDMTICIILEELISFTQRICLDKNIPMRQIKLSRPIWSDSENKWVKASSVKLPIHNNKPIILIPQNYARPMLVYTYSRFYNKQMMPHYERYAINNPSEGLVRILKRGIVPAKVKIRKKYPCIKPDVVDFIRKNPNEYLSYKEKQLKYVNYNNI